MRLTSWIDLFRHSLTFFRRPRSKRCSAAGGAHCLTPRRQRPLYHVPVQLLETRQLMTNQVVPQLVSLDRDVPASSVTAASSVSFTATFSVPVTGVDPTDFALARTGTVGATLVQVAPVSGSHGTQYTIAVSGITGAGTLGVNLVDDDSIHDLSGNRLAGKNSGTLFSNAVTFTGDAFSQNVTTGDFNGDGFLDLIVSNARHDDVSLLLGNGNGTFLAPTTIDSTDNVYRAAVVDLDGDGHNDLILPNYDTGTISVLLGNGNGTFQTPTTFNTGYGGTKDISVIDLNGDGHVDVVVADQGGPVVSVLLGNGNGTFGASTSFGTDSQPESVAIADFNGDGRLDLAVANFSSYTTSVLLGNGNGTFQTQSSYPVGAGPFYVAAADLNHDGHPDLVTANWYETYASVLLGNSDGTFQPAIQVPTDNLSRQIRIADVNLDGEQDLLFANPGDDTVNVLLGNGNGTFQSQLQFAVGDQVTSFVLADVNHDGLPDIIGSIFGTAQVGVLLANRAPDNFTGETYSIDPTAVDAFPHVVSINRTTGASVTGSSVTYTVTFNEDVTGVDATDFALQVGGTIDGTSAVVSTVTPVSGSVYTVAVSGISGSGTLALKLVDDGTIAGLNGKRLTGASGTLPFSTASTFATYGYALAVATSDINGDGVPDVVVNDVYNSTLNVLLLNPDGSVYRSRNISTSYYPQAMSVADVNGDGRADLVFVTGTNFNLGVLLGNGDGTFQSETDFSYGSYVASMTIADLNGDGRADLLLAVEDSNAVGVLLGNGDGTFQSATRIGTASNLEQVAASDLNGDGIPDLVTAYSSGGSVGVFIGNGNGTFQAQGTLNTGLGAEQVAVVDVNRDGRPDLVVANTPGDSLSVLLGNGNGTFQARTNVPAGTKPYGVVAADLNGDGLVDLAAGNLVSNTVSIMLGNGDGSFQAPASFAVGSIPVALAAADLNADSQLDLLVANVGNSPLNVLLSAESNGDFTGQSYTMNGTPTATVTIAAPTIGVADGSGNTTTITIEYAAGTGAIDPNTFDASNITVNHGATVTGFSASGNTVTYTIAAGSGTWNDSAQGVYTIGFAGNVADLNGTPIADNPTLSTFLVDTVTPTVTSIERSSAVTDSSSVTFTVTFSTGVTGVDRTDFALIRGGTVATTLMQVAPVAGSGGTQYLVTVSGITGIGSLTLKTLYDGSIQSLGGNVLTTSPLYQPQVQVAAGSAPWSVVAADLNHDGQQDLVVGQLLGNVVQVLLGNGNGTFQAAANVNAGYRPQSVLAVDVNGDGNTDLVTANYSDGAVSVLLGNGDGTFQGPAALAVCAQPKALAAQDVNGDGFIDLVTTSYSGTAVSVLLGNGNGTFHSAANFAVAQKGIALAIADVNGDQHPDLLVGIRQSGTVSILLGNGDGTFQGQTSVTAASALINLAVADVNGDGRLDLLTADDFHQSAAVLLGNGNGTFQTPVPLTLGSGPGGMLVADVNGDSRPDLLVTEAGNSSVSVLLGNGDGTFQALVPYTTAGFTISAALADVNSDGLPDLLAANRTGDTVSVLLANPLHDVATYTIAARNSSAFPHVVSINRATQSSATTHDSQVRFIVTFSTAVTGVDPTDFAVVRTGTVGTTLVQAAPVAGSGGTQYAVTLSGITGAGTLGLKLIYDGSIHDLYGNRLTGAQSAPYFQTQAQVTVSGAPTSTTEADLNHDGHPDLVVSATRSDQVTVLLGNSQGTLVATTTLSVSNPATVQISDVNGDGNVDLIVPLLNSNHALLLLGNGDGTFQTATSIAMGSYTVATLLLDVNGDGRVDLVAGDNSGTGVRVLLGNGDGTFQAPVSFNAEITSVGLVAADVNGDQIPDLLACSHSAASISVMLGNGNGTFQGAAFFSNTSGTTSLTVADINQDGLPDLIATGGSDGQVHFLFGNGDGTFGAQIPLQIGTYITSAEVLDVDGDGVPDLLVGQFDTDVMTLLLGNGNGTFRAQGNYATSHTPYTPAIGDLNGDGLPDLVFSNYPDGAVGVMLASSPVPFTGETYNIVPRNAAGAPHLLSIDRTGSASSTTSASAVTFTATFNEAVTGVDPSDFALQRTGTLGTTLVQVAPVAGSGGTQYTIAVSGITGAGTLGVTLAADNAIQDHDGLAVTAIYSGPLIQAQAAFAADYGPTSVTTADVNGDGFTDLIAGNAGDYVVSVFLGNGGGTFQAANSIPAGYAPTDVAVADLNGDGALDLIAVDSTSRKLSVLLGNGDGTFQHATTLHTGYGPYSVQVADLNGDGFADLVTANVADYSVSVLLGNGDGTFQPRTNVSVGTAPFTLSIADLNGDNRPDMVVANTGGGTISVLLGNGDGTFQQRADQTAGAVVFSTAVSDLNGDGIPDLILSNRAYDDVSVLLGNGNGTFQAESLFSVGQGPAGSVAADVNGDGLTDLVVSNYQDDNVSVLLGNGNGTFQAGLTYSTGGAPLGVDASDVNGDGIPDLLVANEDSIGVLLASSAVQPSLETYTIAPLNAVDAPRVVSIVRSGSAASTTHADHVSFTITFSTAVTGVDPTDFALVRTGTVGDTLVQVAPVAASAGTEYTITVSGITGIGTLGLNLLYDGTIHGLDGAILTGTVSGPMFQSQTQFAVGALPTSVVSADLNGDGSPDLISGNVSGYSVNVLLGNGDGTFQPQQPLSTGRDPEQVAVADLNGDGDADLLATNFIDGTVSVLLGNGDGTFQSQTVFSTGAHPMGVAAGDLNGDGRVDLVVSNSSDNTVGVLLGNGDGTFQAMSAIGVGQSPEFVSIDDVNGDNRPDLLVANTYDGTVSVLLGNGDGTFQPQTVVGVGTPPYSLQVSDVDGNGVPDLVIDAGVTSSVSVLLGNGNGTFQGSVTTFVGGYPEFAAVSDVNGDGRPDLVTVDGASDFVSLFLGNGNGTFAAASTYSTGSNPLSAGFSDLNGDGLPDLLVSNFDDGTVSVLLASAPDPFVGAVYTIPLINPVGTPYVVSLERAAGADATTSANSVRFTATFSEAVTGVDASDFLPARTGTVGETQVQVAPVSGSGGTRYSITVSGISGSGTLGLNLVYNGSIQDQDGNSLGVAPGDPLFQPRIQVQTGVPTAVVVADVNGDGRADLVSTTFANNGITVQLGNGNGTFQPAAAFSTGFLERNLVVGDVNGDGAPDVIAMTQLGSDLRLLLGNGDGTFQSATTLASGYGPYTADIADLNGDGHADVVTTNWLNSTVSVLLGNGDGTFQSRAVFATSGFPFSVTVADLNGDNRPDLVTADAGGDMVGVLLGNGDGTFQPESTNLAGGAPFDVVVSDVNGDGRPDFVVVNYRDDSVGVFLGNGDGTFQPQVTYEVGDKPKVVSVADVNGDGLPDLLVPAYSQNTLGVLLGNGNGTFQAMTNQDSGITPFRMDVGDVNGDGRPDLAIVNIQLSSISILLGTAPSNFEGESFTIDPTAVIVHPHVVSITTASSLLSHPSSLDFTVTFSEDVTGVDDGDFAAAVTGTLSATTLVVTQVSASVYTVTVSSISGQGSLGLNLVDNGSIYDLHGNPLAGTGAPFNAAQNFPTGNNPDAVALRYVDGDPLLDIVVANYDSNSVSVLLGSGNGTYDAARNFQTGRSPMAVSLGDVNGDGNADIAVINNYGRKVNVLLGNGDGTFAAAQNFDVGSYPRAVQMADFNGDGRLDLSVVNSVSNTVSVLLGNGDGTFAAALNLTTGHDPYSETLIDVNGDGRVDVVVSNVADRNFSVLLGNGDGTFAAAQQFNTGTFPIGITVQDLNEDGRPDVVTTNFQLNSVSVLLGNGNGTFAAARNFSTTGYEPSSVAVGDVNGDGLPDLVVTVVATNELNVLLGNGDGTFAAAQNFHTAGAPSSIVLADIDREGHLDAVYTVGASNSVSIMFGAHAGSFTGQTTVIDNTAPTATVFTAAPTINAANGGALSTSIVIQYADTAAGIDTSTFSASNITLDHGATVASFFASGNKVTYVIGSPSGVAWNAGYQGTYTVSLTGTVKDLVGNAIVANPNFSSFLVSTVRPTVASINRTTPAGSGTNATSVTYSVNFNESVTGVAASDFATARTETVSVANPLVVQGSGATYTVTVSGITGNGTLGLNLVNVGAIQSLSGSTATNGNFTGQVYVVDHTPPTMTGIFRSSPSSAITTAASVTFLVKFSEAVTGVNTNVGADFALAGSAIAGAHIGTPVTNNGGLSWSIPVTGLSSSTSGTVQLKLTHNTGMQDLVANALSTATFSGQGYTLDHTPPTLTRIYRSSPSSPITSATSVTFLVKFSEAVTGVNTNVGTDFALVGSAAAGAHIGTPVTNNGGLTWSIPVTGLSSSASGTVQLTLTHNTGIQDLYANSLSTATFSGQGYTLDHTRPALTGIYRSSPAGQTTAATTVTFLAKFSEAVTGVNTNVGTDFALMGSAATGAHIGTPVTSNGGLTWSIPVTGLSSSASGTVQLNLTHNTGIQDLYANSLSTATFSGQGYTLDHTRPALTGIYRSSPAGRTTAATSVTFLAKFSEAVTGVNTNVGTDFALIGNGAAGAHIGTPVTSNGGLTWSIPVTGLSSSASGTVQLNLTHNTGIQDLYANSLSTATFSGQGYTLDHTRPALTGIYRSSPAGHTTAATTVTFLVKFSEAVTGVNTNVGTDFALMGSAATGAHIGTPVTSNGGLTWSIPVTGLSSSASGTVQVNLTHNTGIQDLYANSLSTATFSGQGYTLDHTHPALTGIYRSSPAGHTTAATSVTFLVKFSEAVTGVNTHVGTDFALMGSAATGAHIGTPVTSNGGLTWSILVTGLSSSASGTVQLTLTHNTGIQDLYANSLSTATFSGQGYTLDHTHPALTGIYRSSPAGQTTAATTVTFLVKFSEAVTGVNTHVGTDFALAGTAIAGAHIGTPVTNNGGLSWSIPVTGLSSSTSGTVQLNLTHNTGIQDLYANSLSTATLSGQGYTLDHTRPALTGIYRSSPAGQTTSATTVTFLVKFSEAVTGVNTNVGTDFALMGSAAAGAHIGTPVTNNGGLTWSIPVTGLSSSASGTVQLNLTHNTGIQDLYANSLSTATFSGQGYTLDHTRPTLTGIYRSSPAGQTTSATTVTFLVKFSEAVTGVNPHVGTDFALAGTASAGAHIGTPATNNGGLTWSIPVTGLSSMASGPLQLTLTHNTGIRDLLGNSLATSTFSGQAYTLDHTPPELTGILRASPASAITSATNVTFLLTFSEAVTGLDTHATDLVLTGTAVAGGRIGTPLTTDGGLTWSVAVADLSNTANGTVQLKLARNTGIEDLAGNTLTKPTLHGEKYTLQHPSLGIAAPSAVSSSDLDDYWTAVSHGLTSGLSD